MRGATARVVTATAVVALGLSGCSGEPLPQRPVDTNVADTAAVLTDDEERELNSLIEERNTDSHNIRVAVLTVPRSEAPIDDYAQDVATAWGVGEQGADNGVLVVTATEDRQVSIQVANGARPRVSDAEAQTVVDDVLAPALAEGSYAQGLTTAVERIYLNAQSQDPPPPRPAINPYLVAAVLSLAVLSLAWLVYHIATARRRWGRIADAEILAAEQQDPGLRLSHQQREAYRSYRYAHRNTPQELGVGPWVALYATNPALYSGNAGADTGPSPGGSSFGGGGGFSGGGASGSY